MRPLRKIFVAWAPCLARLLAHFPMRSSNLLTISAALLLTALVAPAANSSPTPQPDVWPLPPLEYFIEHLPAPPRATSYRDRLDLSDAVARQASMTPAQMAQAQKSYAFNVFYFSDIMGPKFTPKNYPKTAAFFQKLTATANVIIVGLKNHYARERPFQAHPDQIKLLVRNEPGYSYPSGHTTRGRLFALVLGELCPEKQRALEASGEQVGVDRILAGEHYRTDLEAGHRLAKMMFLQLQKDPDFLAAVNALRQSEWAKP